MQWSVITALAFAHISLDYFRKHYSHSETRLFSTPNGNQIVRQPPACLSLCQNKQDTALPKLQHLTNAARLHSFSISPAYLKHLAHGRTKNTIHQ